MKILPGLAVSKMSGTVAGTTYQNWRGILVARSKPTPTNVNTPRQSVIRMLMKSLAQAWRDELNQGLRTAWNQRAKNFPWLDVFGNSVSMTGENLYIKQNMVLLDHSLARQDTPVPDTVPPELLGVTATLEEDFYIITIPKLPDAVVASQAPFIDVSIAGGFLSLSIDPLISVGIVTQALSPGRTHQKSDFRHCAYLDSMPESSVETEQAVTVIKPALQPKNIVVSIRRYNKYGNFTAPLLLSVINDFVG